MSRILRRTFPGSAAPLWFHLPCQQLGEERVCFTSFPFCWYGVAMPPVRLWIPHWVYKGQWSSALWRKSSGAEKALDEALQLAIGSSIVCFTCHPPAFSLGVAGFVPEKLQTWEEGPGIPDVPYENRWYRTQCLIHREVVPWAVPWNKVGRHCLCVAR